MPEVPSFSWTAYNSANAANRSTRPRRSSYNRFTVLCVIISRNSESVEYADGTITGPLPTGNSLIRFAEHEQDIPSTFEWHSVPLRGFNEIRYYIREVYNNLFVYNTHDVVGNDGNIVPPASLSTVYEKKNTTLKEGKPLHHHVCSRCKKVSVCQFVTLCSNYKKVKVPCNDCAVKFGVKLTLKVKKPVGYGWNNPISDTVEVHGVGHGRTVTSTAWIQSMAADFADAEQHVAATVAPDGIEVGLPDMHLGNTLRYNAVDTDTAINLYDEFAAAPATARGFVGYTAAPNTSAAAWERLGEMTNVVLNTTAVTPDNQSNTEAHEARNQAVPVERPSGDGDTGDDRTGLFGRFYGDTVA